MMNNTSSFLAKLSTVVFGCYAATVSAASNPASTDYVKSTLIGRHTQGGVVFFTYLSSGGVLKSLVAATEDEPGGNIYDYSAAKTQCTNKNSNGYSDWFLPNKAQISALFNNRFAINPDDYNGGFGIVPYWSSSENGANAAWVQFFDSGSQVTFGKVKTLGVRCVRALSL